MLEIKNLVKRYGNFVAVDHLCLTIPDNSIFGFVGPNGAGKTTTLRIMAGLLKATEGSIWMGDVDMTKNPTALKSKIGYMPDFFGVYDNLKVTEYMDFYAGTYEIPYKDRSALIDNLLEIVDLTHKKNDYVDVLSRGMKQRLCLARALIHDPKLLILDEPASGLDPRARLEMKEILKQLQVMGKTIAISSHILPELAEMCTEIGIINHGILAAQGTVQEIMHQLTKKRLIYIQPLGGAAAVEKAANFLRQLPAVGEITENTNDILFDFQEDEQTLAGILKQLIDAGIMVTSFHEKEGNLEEIFMQVTGGAGQ